MLGEVRILELWSSSKQLHDAIQRGISLLPGLYHFLSYWAPLRAAGRGARHEEPPPAPIPPGVVSR